MPKTFPFSWNYWPRVTWIREGKVSKASSFRVTLRADPQHYINLFPVSELDRAHAALTYTDTGYTNNRRTRLKSIFIMIDWSLVKHSRISHHWNPSLQTLILDVTGCMFHPLLCSPLFTPYRRNFSLTAHGSSPAEAVTAELHGVLVNWQFLVSADMLHYAYLLQCPLHYLPL